MNDSFIFKNCLSYVYLILVCMFHEESLPSAEIESKVELPAIARPVISLLCPIKDIPSLNIQSMKRSLRICVLPSVKSLKLDNR